MKNNTLITIVVLALVAVLLAGTFGAININRDDDNAVDSSACDHLNTEKAYTTQGVLQHICVETCSKCDKVIQELTETHKGVLSDCKVTSVNGLMLTTHDCTYRCSQCGYTWTTYEKHHYNSNYVCTECGTMCTHSMETVPSSDGRYHCTICGYSEAASSTCSHTWVNSVCATCSEVCGHLSGFGLDSEADEPYYFCYICDYTKPVSTTE